jgi:hypothetical protein
MNMKRFLKPTGLFVSMLLVGFSLGTVSCSDDDDNNSGDIVTTEAVRGEYTGKMQSWSAVAGSGEDTADDGEQPAGVDVAASVDADSVLIQDFPIKDIVLSIVGDETVADGIVESVGQVDYRMAYTPALSVAKDSISMELKAEPLKLNVSIPSTTEGESTPLVVEVDVEVGSVGKYSVETGNLKFSFAATKVKLGEGDGQTELPSFNATTFDFDMNKNMAAHYLQ